MKLFLAKEVVMNRSDKRFRTVLAVCAFSACFAMSHLSQAQCLKGDVNQDGTVNMADWLPMVDLLLNEDYLCEGDNGDGQINFLDLAGIQQILLNQQGAAFTNTVTDGVGDFFWSTSNLNEGASNGPLDLTLSPGESVNLYLYYSTNGPSNTEIKIGYSLNVATSQSDIVEFTEADTFNFDSIIGRRWEYPRDATLDGEDGVGVVEAHSVENDLVIGLTAMSLFLQEPGFDEALSSFDEGYDSDAQAFLCGRIQIEAIAPGTIELVAGPNDLGIANSYDLLQPTFARANITVDATVLLGDVNLDGMVTFGDITDFVGLLASEDYQIQADCNQDSYVNFFDITFFIDILSGN